MGGPRVTMHVRRGDTVEVIHGKYRGKRGKVLRVIPDRGRIIVEGVMVAKRHTKPSDKNPARRRHDREADAVSLGEGNAGVHAVRARRAVRAPADGGRQVGAGVRHCGEIIDRA